MERQNKIKILFRLRSLDLGGAQKVMLDLLANLPKNIFDITLLLSMKQGPLRNQIPEGVNIISLTKGKEDFSKVFFINKIQLVIRRIWLLIFDNFPYLLYALKLKKKYDIEIASSYMEYDSVLKSYNKHSKKIAWSHTDITYDRNKQRMRDRIEKMKQFDKVVFCSNYTKDIIKEKCGGIIEGGITIYNAIHVEEIKKKSEEFLVDYSKYTKPVFCSVGRLYNSKGYDVLIEVHAQLLKEGHQHTILILGEGGEREILENKIREYQVQDTFQLLGIKSNPYPYIKESDFFVLPTRTEAYPLVIAEALILEKPIISTNVGGIPEMIDDGIDGVLVNFDKQELYQAMKTFLTQPDLVKNIEANVKKSYLKFDAQKIYNQVTDLLIDQYNTLGK